MNCEERRKYYYWLSSKLSFQTKRYQVYSCFTIWGVDCRQDIRQSKGI